MATIIAVVRRGRENTRVALSDGSTRLYSNSNSDLQAFLSSRGLSLGIKALEATTFGCEFEMTVPVNKINSIKAWMSANVRFADESNHHFCNDYTRWQWSCDGSLSAACGYRPYELKSRVLKFNADDIAELTRVLNYLSSEGCKVNSSCGTHVHLGTFNRSVTSEDNKNLYERYGAWEDFLFDRLVSPSRRSSRWCKTCKNPLNMNDRYTKYNPTSLRKYTTIEFRQHQGTLNAQKILNWAMLCRAWLKYASVSKTVPGSFEDAIGKLDLCEGTKTYLRSRFEDFN